MAQLYEWHIMVRICPGGSVVRTLDAAQRQDHEGATVGTAHLLLEHVCRHAGLHFGVKRALHQHE